MMDIEKM